MRGGRYDDQRTWPDHGPSPAVPIRVVIPTMPQRETVLLALLDDLSAIDWVTGVVVSEHEDSRQDVANAFERGCAAGDSEWLMYLEDDVVLGKRFREIPDLLAPLPDDVGMVSFASLRDGEPGMERITASQFSCTCCLVLRSSLVDGLRAFARGWYIRFPQHKHASDLLLGAYVAMCSREIRLFNPSLVQHKDLPSTFKGRSTKRTCPTFAG